MHSSSRFIEIDLMRSLAICMMVVYHTVYNLHFFHGFSLDPLSTGWWLFARTTAVLFLLLVGISFEIAKQRGKKRQWKRIGIISLCALSISVATYIWDPFTYIRFGILHCIAVSLILLMVLPSGKVKRAIILFAVIGLGQLLIFVRISSELLLPLGVRSSLFVSLDYFPLFPWFGVILLGTLIAKKLAVHMHTYEEKNTRLISILSIPGKHALPIYMLHQPLIIGMLELSLQ